MSLWRLLRTYLTPFRRALVALVALQALQTTGNLLLPAITAPLIDDGILTGDQAVVWRLGGLMLGVSVLQVIFAAGAMWFGSGAAMGFGRDVRAALFRRVTELSAREVSELGASSLTTRITNDVQQVQLLLVMVATMLLAAPLTMVVGVILAVREDAGLSVLLLVAVPVQVLLLGSIVLRMVPAFQQMQERIDRVNTVLREQITGVRVVRAFTREPEEGARFAQANDELTAVSMRAARLMAATFPTATLVVNLTSVALIWIGADRVASGDAQLGSLIAFLTYLLQILFAVVMATFMLSMIPRSAVAAERINEVLDTQPSVRPPARPVLEQPEPGTLELREVGFRFPGAEHPVLAGISFRVEPGTTTALIGSTGAGKTTVLTLAARLADATEGAVLVGGVDVRELDPERLWGAIGFVPQRPYLFGGTVASNPVRPPRRHRRRAVGRARGRPGRRVRAGDARRPGEHDLPGRHERVRRPAPAPVDRARARHEAGRLPVRRFVLRPRRRHRGEAAGGPRSTDLTRRRAARRPAREQHRGRRPDRRARGR